MHFYMYVPMKRGFVQLFNNQSIHKNGFTEELTCKTVLAGTFACMYICMTRFVKMGASINLHFTNFNYL